MTLPPLGLALTGTGVVLFMAGLYGAGMAFGPAFPITLSLVGCGAFVAGLAVLVWQLRRATFRAPHPGGLILAFLAALLHGYESVFLAGDGLVIGFLLWVLAPYVVFLFVSCIGSLRAPAAEAMAVVLLFDLIMHYDIFIAPKSSTAALAILFVPLWNMLVFGPIALLLGWAVHRARNRRALNVP